MKITDERIAYLRKIGPCTQLDGVGVRLEWYPACQVKELFEALDERNEAIRAQKSVMESQAFTQRAQLLDGVRPVNVYDEIKHELARRIRQLPVISPAGLPWPDHIADAIEADA